MRDSKSLTSFDMLSTLSAEETKRIRLGGMFWRFYLGDQWGYVRGSVSEAGNEVYNDPTVTLNYCKAIVDKSTSFLFGKGFSFQFDTKIHSEVKPMIDEVFRYNDMAVKSIMMGQQGGITGDAFLQVAWEDEPDELHPAGKVAITLLPYNTVYPKYDTQNSEKMISCTIKYLVLSENGDIDYVYRQEITKDEIVTYHGETVVERMENPLGVINVVHIKNMPLAGFCYGQSDLVSIVPLQTELNAKVTDVSDIINYHAAPVTIIQGARSKNLEKGAKKVWGGLPKDAKVYNLELSSDLTASNNFIAFIKKSIHELSNTPEMSLGGAGAISNTSGVALQITYSPLLEKTWIKRMTYGEGLRRVVEMSLKLLHIKGDEETKDKLNKIFADKKLMSYAFNPEVQFVDPLPKDEQIQMQLLAQKLNSGLEEPEGALQELGYKGDIAEKLAKIKRYQLEQQQMMFDTGYSGNTPIEHQYGADEGIREVKN